MQHIMFHEYGGPEVLKLAEAPTPKPGPGHALIKIAAAGVNFVEIYQRSGTYNVPLPATIGGEGAGTVQAVGPGVNEVRAGDRVAWFQGSGSYATDVVVPVEKLVPVPEGVSLEQAAAVILQGTTAHVLSRATYPVKPGDRCLVHAAAGGVGLLLCQMIKMAGGYVIGTTSTEDKAEMARQAGADAVILYTRVDFEAEVRRITDGQGLDVVYDSVGKDTFDKSLACLGPLGYMVLFGQSSGFVPPFDIRRLAEKSLFLTRAMVFPNTRTRALMLQHSGEVLTWVAEGKLRVHIDRSYRLSEAGEAQRALAARETKGKLLLIP
jgi:NADPH2:quinone reductase